MRLPAPGGRRPNRRPRAPRPSRPGVRRPGRASIKAATPLPKRQNAGAPRARPPFKQGLDPKPAKAVEVKRRLEVELRKVSRHLPPSFRRFCGLINSVAREHCPGLDNTTRARIYLNASNLLVAQYQINDGKTHYEDHTYSLPGRRRLAVRLEASGRFQAPVLKVHLVVTREGGAEGGGGSHLAPI